MHAIKTQINKKYVTKGGIPVTVVRLISDLSNFYVGMRVCNHAKIFESRP